MDIRIYFLILISITGLVKSETPTTTTTTTTSEAPIVLRRNWPPPIDCDLDPTFKKVQTIFSDYAEDYFHTLLDYLRDNPNSTFPADSSEKLFPELMAIIKYKGFKFLAPPKLIIVNHKLNRVHMELHQKFFLDSFEVVGNCGFDNATSFGLVFKNFQISGIMNFVMVEDSLYMTSSDILYFPEEVFIDITKRLPTKAVITSSSYSCFFSEAGVLLEDTYFRNLSKKLDNMTATQVAILLDKVLINSVFMNDKVFSTILLRPQLFSLSLNEIIDMALTIVKGDILIKNLDEVSIPNIEKEVHKSLGLFTAKYIFSTNEGWLRNISTVYRSSDAQLHKLNTSYYLNFSMGLENLEFGFENYRAKLIGIGPSGKLRGRIGKNSVNFELIITFEKDECNIMLEKLKVEEISNFKVKMTGLGKPLNWLLNYISNWIADKYKNKIVEEIEIALSKSVMKALDRLKCSNIETVIETVVKRRNHEG